MGIQGLLPFVQKACRSIHISQFSGCTVAIDGHCWLHRAAYACSEKLVKGQTTTLYVAFCMRLINLLKSHKITPIMVFDGNALPSKKEVHVDRQQKKRAMRQQAESFEKEGNFKEARNCYNQSLDITSTMVQNVITACKEAGVDYLVAPFEADAQLTYLLNEGIAHLVVTEDSDLIPFGCKRILFKLENNGNATLYERSHLYKCLSPRAELLLSPSKGDDKLLFTRFRYACIMSGCDYHPGGLAGVGLLKATKAMMSCSSLLSVEKVKMLARLPQSLQNMRMTITAEYKDKFIRANETFLHQIVLDPLQRRLLPLTPLPAGMDGASLTHAGHGILTDGDALQMAMGQVVVEYRNSQDEGHSQSPEDSRSPKTPEIATAVETPRKSGIWCSTYQKPAPLRSPTRVPILRRCSTAGETVFVDLAMSPVGLPAPRTPSPVKRPITAALTDLGNASLPRECVKRKLFEEPVGESNTDDVPRPPTPKRSISWSAGPQTKFSRGMGLSRRPRGELSAKAMLSNQTTISQSSYFASPSSSSLPISPPQPPNRLSIKPKGNGAAVEFLPQVTTKFHVIDSDSDDEMIILPSPSSSCQPSRVGTRPTLFASSPSPPVEKKKNPFAHLGCKKPLSQP